MIMDSEQIDKISKINELRYEIEKLDEFLNITHDYHPDIGVVRSLFPLFKKKVSVRYTILGRKILPAVKREQEIDIPDSVKNDIIQAIQKKKKELESELETYFN